MNVDERVVSDPTEECRRLLDVLASRWANDVLIELSAGSRRFSQVEAALPAVSRKSLTATLRRLEGHGMLVRTVTAQVPVRVDYTLTDLGRSAAGLIETIREWAHERVVERGRPGES